MEYSENDMAEDIYYDNLIDEIRSEMEEELREFREAREDIQRISQRFPELKPQNDIADAISSFVLTLTTKWDGKTYHISKTTTNDEKIREFVKLWKQHNIDAVRGDA